jgi:hypothetical protein
MPKLRSYLGSFAAVKGPIIKFSCRILIALFLGHETFVRQVILPGEMSPGNIFLREADGAEGWEELISSLKFASDGVRHRLKRKRY